MISVVGDVGTSGSGRKTEHPRLNKSHMTTHRTKRVRRKQAPLQSTGWSPSRIWMSSTAMWPSLCLSATPSTITCERVTDRRWLVRVETAAKTTSAHAKGKFKGAVRSLCSNSRGQRIHEMIEELKFESKTKQKKSTACSKLIWHTGWNIFQISWIYVTCSSGEHAWKVEAHSKTTWKVTGWIFCPSHSKWANQTLQSVAKDKNSSTFPTGAHVSAPWRAAMLGGV